MVGLQQLYLPLAINKFYEMRNFKKAHLSKVKNRVSLLKLKI